MQNYNHLLTRIEDNILQNRYKGFDPYDFFCAAILPPKLFTKKIGSRISFLNKISPINFRNLLGIQKNYSSMAMSLMLLGYLNYNFKDDNVNFIIDWLVKNKSNQFNEYSIGFAFDLSLGPYFSKKNDAHLIVTLFVMYAFIKYYERTKDDKILDYVFSFEKLIEEKLPKFETENYLWYSYNFHKINEIYNSTAKIGRFFSLLHTIKNNANYVKKIDKILYYLKINQRKDGTWPYSSKNSYTDSFHTAFVLESIWHMLQYVKKEEYFKMFFIGLSNYKKHFFDTNLRPLHFHPQYKPNDFRRIILETEIRDAANAISLFLLVGEIESAEKILNWTIKNMYDSGKSCFYFFKNKFYSNKIYFIRWQAWMFYSLSRLLKEKQKDHLK